MKRMWKIAGGQVHSTCLERILRNTDALVLCPGGGGEREGGDGVGGEGAAAGVSGQDGGSGAGAGAGAERNTGRGRGAWFRRIAVESIAKAIVDGRLQYAFKYERLREEYPEFDGEFVWMIGELERQAAGRRGVGNGRPGTGKGD